MAYDDDMDDDKPSFFHKWMGAVSGGSSIPFSYATGGKRAAKDAIWGAAIGGLLGVNDLFKNKDSNSDYDDDSDGDW